jgi:hypothetical protein
MEQVLPPSKERAKEYATKNYTGVKFLLPDGSVVAGMPVEVTISSMPLPDGAAQDGSDISTPEAMPAGGTGIRGWLSAIFTKLNNTLGVTGTFWQSTQPVSVASIPSHPVTGPLTNSEIRALPIQVEQAVVPDLPDHIDNLDLSYAMDKANQMPLFVEVANPEKRDVLGARVPSDAPGPITWTSLTAASLPITIDTTGYQSIVIHKVTTGIVTPTTSNDGLNWVGMVCCQADAPQTLGTTLVAAAGVYILPVTGKYVRLTGPATLVTCVIYLRQVPFSVLTSTNIGYVGGTTVGNAGLAGVIAVGGNVATAVAPTTNPIQIGGVDAGRLVTPTMVATGLTPKIRRALVDESGRFIPPMVELTSGLNFQAAASAYTKDVSQHEGQSMIEVLNHILVELRALNWQMHELPINIGAGTMNPSDDLDDLRTEMKSYNYNN